MVAVEDMGPLEEHHKAVAVEGTPGADTLDFGYTLPDSDYIYPAEADTPAVDSLVVDIAQVELRIHFPEGMGNVLAVGTEAAEDIPAAEVLFSRRLISGSRSLVVLDLRPGEGAPYGG